ncbi:NnrU family protein [Pseudovibrio sp. SPO723]|nr:MULTISPECIES: NnrU family protein [Pseudovibrio]MDD7908928.1 NnrU family protein [Pseudovibrio exalbescens]MDX5593751.1 NnrU family protein [Pseudovibrio sp. SPO723]
MLILVLGLIVFLGCHMLPTFVGLHDSLKTKMGDGPYRLAFSAVSAIGITLIVIGYGDARFAGYLPIYDPPIWMRHLVLLLMLPVFVLFAAAYLPGHIKKRTKHPMILSVKIWALAHLLANGEPQSLLLFGGFLAWGVIDRISLKKRDLAQGGPAQVDMSHAVRNDAIALIIGLGIYLLFVWKLHELIIGVSVIG